MEKTANYGLPQWEKSDFIKMDDFNAAFGKLDTALKAETDARTAADRSSAETVTAIAQTLGTGGQNCRIAWGSYTGDGKYGSGNPCSLSFDFTPVLLIMVHENYGQTPTSIMRGLNRGTVGSATNVITWGEKKVTWYCENTGVSGDKQLNESGAIYRYVALGY